MEKYLIILLASLLFSCEEEFIPEIDESDQEYIVEGFIEDGPNSTPPYVILSRSFPFFGEISAQEIFDLQIGDAEVSVLIDSQRFELTHVCLSDIPNEFREQITDEVGFLPVFEDIDFCLYIDIQRSIPIHKERPYGLEINLANGDQIRGETTIPNHVPIQSFQFTRPPGENQNDSMARLLITVEDPQEPNFYRYMTAGEGEPFRAGFASVTDDRLFDGETFDFPLQKAVSQEELEEVDPENFGLYMRGDSVRIRWLNIDKPHFDFWNTYEFNLNNQGPFSSYTRVSSNISGGLGVWGGYSSSEYQLYVPVE